MREPGAGVAEFPFEVVARSMRERIRLGEIVAKGGDPASAQVPGELPPLLPGTVLPAVKTLAGQYTEHLGMDIGHSAMDRALKLLASEGLIMMPGRGYNYVVRSVIRLPLEFTGFTVEGWEAAMLSHGRKPAHRWVGTEIIEAAPLVASMLGVRAGTGLIGRRTLRLVNALPSMLETACYPVLLVADGPLASPRAIPGDELALAGLHEDRHVDDFLTRGPDRMEARHLGLPSGTAVVEWTRYGYEQDPETGAWRAIRAVVRVLRSDTHRIRIASPAGNQMLHDLGAG